MRNRNHRKRRERRERRRHLRRREVLELRRQRTGVLWNYLQHGSRLPWQRLFIVRRRWRTVLLGRQRHRPLRLRHRVFVYLQLDVRNLPGLRHRRRPLLRGQYLFKRLLLQQHVHRRGHDVRKLVQQRLLLRFVQIRPLYMRQRRRTMLRERHLRERHQLRQLRPRLQHQHGGHQLFGVHCMRQVRLSLLHW